MTLPSITEKTLKRLEQRNVAGTNRFLTESRASSGRYAQRVRELTDGSFFRRERLLNEQQFRENQQLSLREQFSEASRYVLGDKTLDWLREQGSINAPTLTSVFAGYESARADEAGRFERFVDENEESVERTNRTATQFEQFQTAEDGRVLTAESNLFNQYQNNLRAGMSADQALGSLVATQGLRSAMTTEQIGSANRNADNRNATSVTNTNARIGSANRNADNRIASTNRNADNRNATSVTNTNARIGSANRNADNRNATSVANTGARIASTNRNSDARNAQSAANTATVQAGLNSRTGGNNAFGNRLEFLRNLRNNPPAAPAPVPAPTPTMNPSEQREQELDAAMTDLQKQQPVAEDTLSPFGNNVIRPQPVETVPLQGSELELNTPAPTEPVVEPVSAVDIQSFDDFTNALSQTSRVQPDNAQVLADQQSLQLLEPFTVGEQDIISSVTAQVQQQLQLPDVPPGEAQYSLSELEAFANDQGQQEQVGSLLGAAMLYDSWLNNTYSVT